MSNRANELPLAAPQSVPRVIGKHEILRSLATGGMAEIFLARARGIEGFEKLVVLKRIRPEMAGDTQFVQMFLDEARVLATLQHSHIVSVYDVGAIGGSYFFSMEFLHGEDVRSIIKRTRTSESTLPLEHAVYITMCTLAGLHYAHQKAGPDGKPLNIVHRDVSPSNIFVTFEGGVKLVDFGIAKTTTQSTQTRAGTLKGKVRYMSPEQCLAQAVDRRSDVFSTAIVLWELTTGRRLFRGTSDFEIFKQILEEDVPKPSSIKPDYPPELEAIVLRGLRRDPNERYQTAQIMQAELEAFAREAKLAASSLSLASYMQTLFADRLEAWNEAERAGRSLAEHIVEVFDESQAAITPSQTGASSEGEQEGEKKSVSRVSLVSPGVSANTLPTVSEGAGTGSSPGVEAPRSPEDAGAQRRVWPIALGAGIALALAGGMGLWMSSSSPPASEQATSSAASSSPAPDGVTTTSPTVVAATAPSPSVNSAEPASTTTPEPTASAALAEAAAGPQPAVTNAVTKMSSPSPKPAPIKGPSAPAATAKPSATATTKPPAWDKDSPFLPP